MQIELWRQKTDQRLPTEVRDGKRVMKRHKDVSGDDASSLC